MKRYNHWLLRLLAVTVLMSPMLGWSAIDVHEFSSEQERLRFHGLVEELRCPKCQNQNLIDSNSAISIDLRDQVARMVNEGQSNSDIKSYMVQRYGEFVLYKPAVSKSTYILWLAPFVMLLIGASVFIVVVWRRKQIARTQFEDNLTDSH